MSSRKRGRGSISVGESRNSNWQSIGPAPCETAGTVQGANLPADARQGEHGGKGASRCLRPGRGRLHAEPGQDPGERIGVVPAVPGVDSHGHPATGFGGGEILKPERQGRLAVAPGAVQGDVLRDVRPPPLVLFIDLLRRARQDPLLGGSPGQKRRAGACARAEERTRDGAPAFLVAAHAPVSRDGPPIVWGRGFLSNHHHPLPATPCRRMKPARVPRRPSR